jgi:glutaryl-CoA dehydrogenase
MLRHLSKATTSVWDPLRVALRWTPEERMIQEVSHRFAQEELRPRIDKEFRNCDYDKGLIKELGELGLLGVTTLDEPSSYTSYGIIARELEAVDSAYRSAMSVQSSLVIYPIATYGTEQQKKKYLEPLRNGDAIGAFGLTEPMHGSDPSGMQTKARKSDDGYVLEGIKSWITNAPIADTYVVWARDDEGEVGGYILESGMAGLSAPVIENKMSLRASCTGQIVMDNVTVPKENKLEVSGLKGPLSCLNQARFGIAWGALGAASDSLQVALEYGDLRTQFGKSLTEFQITQYKTADLVTRIGLGLASCQHVAELRQKGADDFTMTSILKRANCDLALQAAQTSRDMMGGNGIVDEYSPIRHLLNMQAVTTYEGTSDIHALIIGKAVTGAAAFS